MQSQIPEIAIFLVVSSIILLGFIVFILYLMLSFNKRQAVLQQNIEILKLNEQKNILNAQLEIQENTFKTISEEIHDNISLSLTLAKLHLNSCNHADTERVAITIESSVDLISKALVDLNDISKSLDADLIEKQGLIHALEYEKELLERNGQYIVNLDIEGEPEFMASAKELLIFRMIQESCNNIVKHAEATKIAIRLIYLSDNLNVIVSDNGKGFDPELIEKESSTRRNAGLKNIRNRAALMKGTVSVCSKINQGSSITIQIPIDKHENS
jgi:signal transduction histidine kinase